MTQFQGLDYYDADSLLAEEERQVRDTVRAWVTEKIFPVIEKHAREDTFPMELVPEMGELGFFGASFHEYGCAGLSHVAYGLIMQELERGDSGVRSFVSVQGALVMYPILSWAPRSRRRTGCRACAPAR